MKVNVVIILRDNFTWHKGEGFLPPHNKVEPEREIELTKASLW